MIGGHNSYHNRIFNFITTKGTFSYNEVMDSFKSKFQVRKGRTEINFKDREVAPEKPKPLASLPLLFSLLSYRFKVILHPDLEDGGYWMECFELPGCSSQGDSVEEALDMIKDAIKGHLEVREELKKEVGLKWFR